MGDDPWARVTRFSPDRVYRYTLWRQWDDLLTHDRIDPWHVAFIGLNPSTADESLDDPTIRRCIGFAKSWGFQSMVMLNLFAYRATDPAVMRAAPEPIGAENDEWIKTFALTAVYVVFCWGSGFKVRGDEVRKLLAPYAISRKCFGVNKDGEPKHPLYLSKRTELIPV